MQLSLTKCKYQLEMETNGRRAATLRSAVLLQEENRIDRQTVAGQNGVDDQQKRRGVVEIQKRVE